MPSLNGLLGNLISKSWNVLPLPVRRRVIWFVYPTYTVGVSVVLTNERDEILYLRHRFREHRGWELPGGLVVRGERLEEALQREIREETGYRAEILSLVEAHVGPPLHVDVCFMARVLDGTLTVDHREIVEARFFAREEVPSSLRPDQVETIDRALRVRTESM